MKIKAGDDDPLNIKSAEIANAIPSDEPDNCKACAAMGALKWLELDKQPMPTTVQELANYTSATLACAVSYLIHMGVIEFTTQGRMEGHMLTGDNPVQELLRKLAKGGLKRQVMEDGSVLETGVITVERGPDGRVTVEGDVDNAPDHIKAELKETLEAMNAKRTPPDLLSKLLDDLSRATGKPKKYDLN